MAELNVSKKSIFSLLSEMQGRKFVIPDYQRPYKWDQEKCEILWQDVTGFYEENQSGDQEYYLGTIVTCKGASDDSSGKSGNATEVIDGQQRITSLLLLLRAFYKKLEDVSEDANILGLKNQIAPCIWDVAPISGQVTDKSRIHIESRVATESDNGIFHEILKTGNVDPSKKDLYSRNYAFFAEQCDKYAKDNPTHWQPFCVTLLKRCIILPIECDNFDSALRIFSTLNDRGMPLSDSDIFKAQIYRTKVSADDKKEFTAAWKSLTERVEGSGMSLDDLFRYYSHIVRAKNADKSKEIRLRKFYAGEKNDFERLKSVDLMDELSYLAEFWIAVAKRSTRINDNDGNDKEMISDRALQYLHCLEHYPNEYWKYATSVFYFRHRNLEPRDFDTQFRSFLKTLISYLFCRYVLTPTVNAIKDPIYQMCIELMKGKPLTTDIALTNEFRAKLSDACDGKITRALVLLHAYLNPNQKELLPPSFDIEHIFPRKWQNTNYFGWTKDAALAYLERFGNKVAIEKKVNILAGNGYFGEKKRKYASSSVEEVKSLKKYPKDDWAKDDIEKREEQFLNDILRFVGDHLPVDATS